MRYVPMGTKVMIYICDPISCKQHQQLLAKYSSVPVKHPWAFGTHWPKIGGFNTQRWDITWGNRLQNNMAEHFV